MCSNMTILEKVKSHLWNLDSDDTDSEYLEHVSDNGFDEIIVRDTETNLYYRLKSMNYDTVTDSDIEEVERYEVKRTGYVCKVGNRM